MESSPGRCPLFKRIRINLNRSADVVNNPECPATPWKRAANFYCVFPLIIFFVYSVLNSLYINPNLLELFDKNFIMRGWTMCCSILRKCNESLNTDPMFCLLLSRLFFLISKNQDLSIQHLNRLDILVWGT